MEDRNSRKRSVLFLALVLIGVTIYYFFVAQGSPVFRLSVEKGTFAFTGPKNTSVTFTLDALETLELYNGDTPDWGTALDGGTVLGGIHYGTWQSTALGTYQAFVTERIHFYILAKDGEKTAVFNTENNETTKSLFEQLDAFRRGELKKTE